MKSVGTVMKTIMPVLTLVSEDNRYICDGCGIEVILVDMTILGGPDKGTVKPVEKGCICWEIEQGKQALKELQRLKIKSVFDQNSIINPDLQQASFDNYKPSNEILTKTKQTAMKFVEEFSLNNPINLLFSGKYGLGKSYLSASICKALNDKGFSTVFISVPKLLTKIRSTFSRNSESTEAQLLDVLVEVDCLALDDIGSEKVKKEEKGESWAVEKLYEIIDGRSGRHTIYTTSLSSDNLRRKVGERNFSRMMMNTKPFKFEGEDYRIKYKRF